VLSHFNIKLIFKPPVRKGSNQSKPSQTKDLTSCTSTYLNSFEKERVSGKGLTVKFSKLSIFIYLHINYIYYTTKFASKIFTNNL
jgi:hypothetical protein